MLFIDFYIIAHYEDQYYKKEVIFKTWIENFTFKPTYDELNLGQNINL